MYGLGQWLCQVVPVLKTILFGKVRCVYRGYPFAKELCAHGSASFQRRGSSREGDILQVINCLLSKHFQIFFRLCMIWVET